jgi:hypothetical protein
MVRTQSAACVLETAVLLEPYGGHVDEVSAVDGLFTLHATFLRFAGDPFPFTEFGNAVRAPIGYVPFNEYCNIDPSGPHGAKKLV